MIEQEQFNFDRREEDQMIEANEALSDEKIARRIADEIHTELEKGTPLKPLFEMSKRTRILFSGGKISPEGVERVLKLCEARLQELGDVKEIQSEPDAPLRKSRRKKVVEPHITGEQRKDAAIRDFRHRRILGDDY